ncbi:MAG TPA: hypothetical protein VFS29_12285, partial [Motilibacteraceae bacterium]|nr:hypothetical protein [Motilibacteraceae bacterium]
MTESGQRTGAELVAAGDPVGVLERIGFLLERANEPTYRVKAFRTAAAVVAGLQDGEVERRVKAGTLTDLQGIGPKTAQVVREVLEGTLPPYLARLEEDVSGPVATGGEVLRELLRGDLHTHSEWSDGGSPIEVMARAARGLGHDYV